MSFLVAGRLIRRYGPAVVITLGSVSFAASLVWWALAVTASPDYVTGVLGGMILSGVGVGLTLPTMMATAAASLPPNAFATGSAVINMIRQTGLALGVAVLVALVGTGAARHSTALGTFRHAWWLAAAICLAGIVPAVALLRQPRPVPAAAPAVALMEV
jgi:MFS family permease